MFDLEETDFVVKPAKVEIGAAYTVSVNYENDKPILAVKTYGTVDLAKVQKELEGLFPNVRISHSAQNSCVTVAKKAKGKRK